MQRKKSYKVKQPKNIENQKERKKNSKIKDKVKIKVNVALH
jgi:hypothetical protein